MQRGVLVGAGVVGVPVVGAAVVGAADDAAPPPHPQQAWLAANPPVPA